MEFGFRLDPSGHHVMEVQRDLTGATVPEFQEPVMGIIENLHRFEDQMDGAWQRKGKNQAGPGSLRRSVSPERLVAAGGLMIPPVAAPGHP